jgi:5S rRNA maturation endonuclease (ribonuclease M5)
MHSKSVREKTLDLKKVKDIIFDDIDLLLEDLELEYERQDDNIFMCCPIHAGSDNPQGLSISLYRKAWRCWTRGCHEDSSTDIFGFIGGCLKTDNFSEILRYVCNLYSVDGAKTNKKQKSNLDKDSELFKKLVKQFKKERQKIANPTETFIGPFPKKMLGGSPYFESRGFNRETLKHFGVRDSDSFVMRNRSIIPVVYKQGKIGFIARATKEWVQPKYLFSEGFKKTDYLYNYDNAIKRAQEIGCIFLVEGQGDVWKLYEAGVYNAVGLFGKDISRSQRSLLLNSGVTKLVILTDNDQAGREAKIKIKRDMSRMFKLIFPKMKTKDLGNMFTDKIKQDILDNLQGHF